MRPTDIPALVEFFNENEKLEKTVVAGSVPEFTEWYVSPSNHTLYTLAFALNAAGSEGKLVGEMEFIRRGGEDQVMGWMHVHPGYRLNGVGRALYAEFERLLAGEDVASVVFPPNAKATLLIEFLRRRGFEFDRYFWTLQLPPDRLVDEAAMLEGITVRTFRHGADEELFAHVRNATFAGHYGSIPRTLEEMTYYTRQEHFRAEGVFFAFRGDDIAGFSYTLVNPQERERRGVSVGHVLTLGVMPTYRKQGIGRALLLSSIEYLRQYAEVVELDVEGKNEDALHLYTSVGFQKHNGWVHMRKSLTL